MRPTMVCNFMTFAGGARNDLRMLRDVFADHEKSCFDMVSREEIEQFWGKGCTWSIVKCHCDVRAIDVH